MPPASDLRRATDLTPAGPVLMTFVEQRRPGLMRSKPWRSRSAGCSSPSSSAHPPDHARHVQALWLGARGTGGPPSALAPPACQIEAIGIGLRQPPAGDRWCEAADEEVHHESRGVALKRSGPRGGPSTALLVPAGSDAARIAAPEHRQARSTAYSPKRPASQRPFNLRWE